MKLDMGEWYENAKRAFINGDQKQEDRPERDRRGGSSGVIAKPSLGAGSCVCPSGQVVKKKKG